jgi:hypothetical protein
MLVSNLKYSGGRGRKVLDPRQLQAKAETLFEKQSKRGWCLAQVVAPLHKKTISLSFLNLKYKT